MAGPIYKLWMFRPTEAWYQLSKEERDSLANKVMEDIEKFGKSVLMCTPTWSTERWYLFGVDEYPDIEAGHRHRPPLWQSGDTLQIRRTSVITKVFPS